MSETENAETMSPSVTLVWCCDRGGWAEPGFCWGNVHRHYDVEVDGRTGKVVTLTSPERLALLHAESTPTLILPPPLTGPRWDDVVGDRFAWGVVVQTHRVGRYAVIEALRDLSKAHGSVDYSEHGTPRFYSYVDDKRTAHSHHTLDGALAYCLAYAHDGTGTRAADYFMRAIGAGDRA